MQLPLVPRLLNKAPRTPLRASTATGRLAARAMDSSKAAQEAAQLLPPQLEGEEDAALVAAVIDNRAGEVGLAVLEAGGGALLLAQHVETTRTFAQTL